MPDTYIEAEYQDGYVHSEKALNDVSSYDGIHNVFYDILNKLPEAEHGPMVRFSLFTPTETINVDWTVIPDNARPIRVKYLERDHNVLTGEEIETRLMKQEFGYQYNDKDGKNIKHIEEVK